MLRPGGPRRRLRMDSRAPPKQACRDYPRIVDHQELVPAQKTWKFREQAVFESTRGTTQTQETRSFTMPKGALRDLLFGEMKVQFLQLHGSGSLAAKWLRHTSKRVVR